MIKKIINTIGWLFIFVFLIALLILVIYGLIITIAEGETYKKLFKEKCLEVGGEIIKTGLMTNCIDIDEEGYRFYWRMDQEGRMYKER